MSHRRYKSAFVGRPALVDRQSIELYDVLETWRDKALQVEGDSLDCGHFIQEEAEAATVTALLAFLDR